MDRRFSILRFVCLLGILIGLSSNGTWGQNLFQPQKIEKFSQKDKFRQLEEILPTANSYRTASGAPGSSYWQQRANYDIQVELNDENQSIKGSEKITYFNRSPDTLRYLWMQIENNIFAPDSDANLTKTAPFTQYGVDRIVQTEEIRRQFDGSVNITRVASAKTKKPLKHSIVKTMMRIDLPKPLKPGESFAFFVDWNYKINNSRIVSARTGYEYFRRDRNYLYEMAHWFPRMCSYTDATGWQHKQFLGRGEFTLEFGDYSVKITAPSDHVVAATGVLQNPDKVMTEEQRARLEKAKTAKKPVFVITPEEAKANEKSRSKKKKTWFFKAENVRDFAWASSRKFIWDAWQHDSNGNKVMAMSFYPNEGEPLWSKYSTQAIVHTMEVYSRYTFDYPYPTAISVNGPVGGMEYPMICFNGPRPYSDGTYTSRTKYGLISVIIHEVGHNYFPMIVNSDERQWTWMDEGLNTFLQYLAEQEWEENYPSRSGEPKDIVGYMKSTNQVPIMTNSESILQFGPNAYSKPATALNILRETILGRELFDFAFREYAQRWKFKRPMPADFFRSMEDASGIDLDWFWHGWFYTTDHVDIAITNVRQIEVVPGDPAKEKSIKRDARDSAPTTLSMERNQPIKKRTEKFPELNDFYNKYDQLKLTELDKKSYESYLKSLPANQKEEFKKSRFVYLLDFENFGGLVMPLIFEFKFTDKSTKTYSIPAEIWRHDNLKVTKMVITDKPVESITLDPRLQTGDVDLSNNHFPPKMIQSRYQRFRSRFPSTNPLRDDKLRREREEREKKEAAKKEAARKEAARKEAARKEAAKKAAEKKEAAEKKKSENKAPARKGKSASPAKKDKTK